MGFSAARKATSSPNASCIRTADIPPAAIQRPDKRNPAPSRTRGSFTRVAGWVTRYPLIGISAVDGLLAIGLALDSRYIQSYSGVHRRSSAGMARTDLVPLGTDLVLVRRITAGRPILSAPIWCRPATAYPLLSAPKTSPTGEAVVSSLPASMLDIYTASATFRRISGGGTASSSRTSLTSAYEDRRLVMVLEQLLRKKCTDLVLSRHISLISVVVRWRKNVRTCVPNRARLTVRYAPQRRWLCFPTQGIRRVSHLGFC